MDRRGVCRRLALAVGVLAGGALFGGAPNLLRNGGFEDGIAPWIGGFGLKAEAVRVVGSDAASGQGCLRFACSGRLAAVDHPELEIGRDLQRLGTYRLGVMVRNDGVRVGSFGLRLYFHDDAGQFLAMLGGITLEPTTATHGWQLYETRFGRGTAAPMPPGSARLLVRFSFWAADGNAAGCVWLDDVCLEQVGDLPQRAVGVRPTALLWDDPALTAAGPPAGTAMQCPLEAAGFQVRRVTTDELCGPGVLDIAAAAAVALPYGPSYPAPLTAALLAFLAEGGLLLNVGPGAFSQPLYPTAEGWTTATAASAAGTTLPLSFATGWTLSESGPEDHLTLVPSAAGTGAELRFEPLVQYAYVGTTLAALPAPETVLALEARGAATTPWLCLELRERDGSRWKAVVPLASTWTPIRLHAGQFVAYANEKLGRQDSVIQPAEINRLFIGLPAVMAGTGTQRLEVRALRFESAAVAAAAVARTPVFGAPGRDVARWFGSSVKLPSSRPELDCFGPAAQRWTSGRLQGSGAAALAPAPTLHGSFSGLAVGAVPPLARPSGSPRPTLAEILAAPTAVERLPFLRTDRRFSAAESDAAALFLHRQGPLAGSRWLCLGLDCADFAASAALTAAVAEGLILARDGILSLGIEPRFRVEDGAVVMDVVWRRSVVSDQPHEARLALRVSQAGRRCLDQVVAVPSAGAAASGPEQILARGLAVRGQEWLDLEIEAVAEPAGCPVLGPLRFRLDALGALRRIADHMTAQAADDNRLHGYSFIDNRGMRVLLAAAEILDRQAYRKTALRWADTMVAEQRADGGYRMGYGISARGEECYVADGGEVAVAIARMVSYSTGRQRQQLLRSLDAYMAYRDDFRVPGGGIGVGWCLQDYGQRPVVPLDVPTRIYAPEINTYTIGCTLAAAYAHAALYGSTPLEHRAEADAEWLLSRTPALHGAFMESVQFAHAFSTDPTQRLIYADAIRRALGTLLPDATSAGRSWWLGGGGRHAQDLGGFAYALDRLGDDPPRRAEMMRATCRMFSPDSPDSVLTVLQHPSPGHDGWICICFGSLGLVDVIRPGVSMAGFVPRR